MSNISAPNISGLVIKRVAATAGLLALAACATPAPPPPPPPPPPPVVESVPYRPVPPSGAPYVMAIPGRGSDGVRMTINAGLNQSESLWHLRSGWNVAALNCQGARYEPIAEGYGAFLTGNASALSAANDALEAKFRSGAASRRAAIRAREAHSTRVYNYFALPSARQDFCNVALQLSQEALGGQTGDAAQFAFSGLARVEAAFENFYSGYERYQQMSAQWDGKYGGLYGASQPGYVAVHGSGGGRVPSSLVAGNSGSGAADQVPNPGTGGSVSTPVVQPLAEGSR